MLWSAIVAGRIKEDVSQMTRQTIKAWLLSLWEPGVLWSAIAAGGIVGGVNHAIKQ